MILIARPRPIIQGSDRVYRGGGWYSNDHNCRLARPECVPTFQYNDLGFRVILRKKVGK